jgi:hypothetical protein
MSHYVDGEVLRAYFETGTVEGAVEQLAGQRPHRHRARTRVRRVLAQTAKAFSEGMGTDAFPRLPEEYREVLARLAAEGAEPIERELAAEAR